MLRLSRRPQFWHLLRHRGASLASDVTYAGSSADGTLTIAASSYLEVTRNPTNQVASAGSRVSFVAGAAGSPSPTVQWQVSTDGGHTFGNTRVPHPPL